MINKIRKIIIETRSIIYKNKLQEIRIGNFTLSAPVLHPIKKYLKNSATYSRNFPRLVKSVSEVYQNPKVIDIGANIGDTVALVRSVVDCPIVCIEPDEKYYELLKKNVVQFRNVTTHNVFLGERDTTIKGSLDTSLGTAKFENNEKEDVAVYTLESFLAKQPQDLDTKILKIDTDGFDTKIIRGARKFIQTAKPIIFFEFDHFYLQENKEDGIEALTSLKNEGYRDILLYDNMGRLLLATELSEIDALRDLYNYTYRKKGAFPYFDVCVFHSQDEKIAKKFILEERSFYENIV